MVWWWWASALVFATPLGFQPGVTTLDEPFVSAQRCAVCHVDEAAQWAASRHAVAHSNTIYLEGLRDEPLSFCVRCHSPLQEQARDVEPIVADWARQPRGHRAPSEAPMGAASEGVTCVVCHQRDGQILATSDSGRSPHDVRVEPALGTSEWCGSCHQFEMFRAAATGVEFTGELMQATLQEWQQWSGRQTCQDCHMPDGAHTFAGSHDLDALRESVQVRVRGGELRIRSVGVGHSLPTGDLFRNITVEADRGAGFEVLHTIGRRFAVAPGAELVKRLASDTTLQPGTWQRIALGTGVRAWRVRYHYGSSLDEHRMGSDNPEWVVTLYQGEID